MAMHRRGFTLVEIMVTLTILVILITLAVVNLRGNLPKARDTERESDISSLAAHLESFARTKSSSTAGSGQGTYFPTAALALDSETFAKLYLPDVNRDTLRAPEVEESDPMSFIAATNNSTDPLLVKPTPTTTTYVYQPLRDNGALCTLSSHSCRTFNLYYKRETPSDEDHCKGDPKVYCKVESRNQ